MRPRCEKSGIAVTWAGLNYEVWWAYRSPDTRPKHIETMNRCAKFFSASQHAHFVALIMALYRLYETRNDTYSIPLFLKHLRKQGIIEKHKLVELEKMHRDVRTNWKKMSTLRNKAFAHRTNELDIDDVFKEADICPDDIKALIAKTEKLMNTLSKSVNRSVHIFNYGSGEDAVQLLQDLRR